MYKVNNMVLCFLFYFVLVLSFASGRENNILVNKSDWKTCRLEDTIDIQVVKSYTNGTVLSKYGYVFTKDQYYNMTDSTGRRIIRGCVCDIKPCITKCTANGTNYTHDQRNRTTLVNASEVVFRNIVYQRNVRNFEPTFYAAKEPIDDQVEYWAVVENPCVYGKYQLFPEQQIEDSSYLQLNGSLLFGDVIYTSEQYCLDMSMTNNSVINAFICFTKEQKAPDQSEVARRQLITTIHAGAALVSVPFLVATFLVYLLIPKLRNLHGKSLMCHIVCLTTFYIFFSNILTQKSISDVWCDLCAFVTYYSFLGSCFWLNVMSFDIWWSFRSYNRHYKSSQSSEQKKFIFYSIYAWGVPLLILIFVLVMQYSPGVDDRFRPYIGYTKCWFDENLVVYFYTPMLCLVVCNMLFFLSTAFKIYKIQKETAILVQNDSQRHNFERENQRFKLYLKLFILMGVNWIYELISYFSGGPDYIWYIFDVLNCLLGVIIFVLFVFKRKIIKLVIKRYQYITEKYHLTCLSCKCCTENKLYLEKDTSQSMSKDEQSSMKNNTKKISRTSTANEDVSL